MSKVTNVHRSINWSVNDLSSAGYTAHSPELVKHLDDAKELRKALDALACVSDAVTKILGGSGFGLKSWTERLAERSTDQSMPSVYVAMKSKRVQDKYGDVLAALNAAAKLAAALKNKTNDAATHLMEATVVHKNEMNKVLSRQDG